MFFSKANLSSAYNGCYRIYYSRSKNIRILTQSLLFQIQTLLSLSYHKYECIFFKRIMNVNNGIKNQIEFQYFKLKIDLQKFMILKLNEFV